jgi:hypothetical protein
VAAQESRGAVRGVVTDPTHAVVPGAKVTLHNTATGVEVVKPADSGGFYAFERVIPGTYNVIVEASGFEKFVQENIVVQTAADVTVNAVLTLGAVTQTVEVTAAVGQVEFNTSTMSDTVQQSFLKDLPILARNPFTLALLDAGVINQYWDEAHRLPFYMWSDGGMDIGGPTGGKNEQIIDGTRTDMAARGSYNAPMDAVQEVVVQQQIPDSEHGWSGGGAVNISMKSGTNDFHGSAYAMTRQPPWNALANRVTRSSEIVKQNIWGGTIGGPIVKNKLFDFFAYEHWYATQPSILDETLPTPAELTGDFSQAIQNNGQPRLIYDPTTSVFNPATDTLYRTPISCNGRANVICPRAMSPAGALLMNYMWAPNHAPVTPDGANNFQDTFAWWTKYHNLSERVDYNLSDKWRMYAHYSYFRTRLDNVNPTSNDSIAFPSQNGGIMDATSSGMDALYMMSPRTTIDIRLGVNYTEDDYNSAIYKLKTSTPCPAGAAANVNCDVWASLWPNNPWYTPTLSPTVGVYFPNFNWSGLGGGNYTSTGGWWYDHLRTYSPQIIVTHEMGKHHLKAGWQFRYEWMQNWQSVGPGSIYFNSVDTAAYCCGMSGPSYTPDGSGDMYASQLLGVVDSADATIYPISDQVHNHLYAAYVQDDFRLNSRTTLNLGIRWEHETWPSDDERLMIRTLDMKQAIANWPSSFQLWTPAVQNAVTSVSPAAAALYPTLSTLVVPQYNGAAVRTSNGDPVLAPGWNVFLPRLGIAYRLNDKTALRFGYSRFAVTWLSNSSDDSIIMANGYSETTNALGPLEGLPRSFLDNPYPPTGTYANPLVLPSDNLLGPYTDLGNNWSFYDGRQYKVPMNDRFTFNIQRQLPAQFRLDATEYLMFEHNAQDGSMWGGYGSSIGSVGYNGYGYPFEENLNQMNPMYSYKYQGLLSTAVPNPFYGQFPATYTTSWQGNNSYTGPYMPGYLGTSSTVPLGQLLQPYPQYGSLWLQGTPGNRDHYYGLALSVTRPMSHGWTFLGTYNYSLQSHTSYYDDIAQYNRNLTMWDRGYPRHNIRLSGTYQVPIGRGRTYLSNAPRWLDEIVGGWATSNIFYWMSGDLLGFPESGMVCDPRLNIPAGYWFNANCITTPPAYTMATAPPYYEGLRGPRYWDLDSTAVKYFRITERVNLEFRLEMYNMPNIFIPSDPNICAPASCGYGYAGKSYYQAAGSNGANYGRELQISGRVRF